MNAKIARSFRNEVIDNKLSAVEIENFVFVGRSSEGAVFSNGTDTVVLRVIVKAEGVVATDLVADFNEKQEKAAERKRKAAEAKAKAGK